MYMMLGILTTIFTGYGAAWALVDHQLAIAACVLGIGTYFVFQFGRLHGLKEIK